MVETYTNRWLKEETFRVFIYILLRGGGGLFQFYTFPNLCLLGLVGYDTCGIKVGGAADNSKENAQAPSTLFLFFPPIRTINEAQIQVTRFNGRHLDRDVTLDMTTRPT